MIREEKKIDDFINREAKALKAILKSGSVPSEMLSFDIFIDNIISDFQIDKSQVAYLRKKSIEILNEKNIKITGM